MAKKKPGREVNKSAAIRDYIKANAEAGPTAVAEALNAQHGWKISAAYVSTIKNKMNEGKGGRRRRGRVARAAANGSGGVNATALIQAKKLAEESGGIDQAKAALDLLGRLTT